jgi:hypothetical protein
MYQAYYAQEFIVSNGMLKLLVQGMFVLGFEKNWDVSYDARKRYGTECGTHNNLPSLVIL